MKILLSIVVSENKKKKVKINLMHFLTLAQIINCFNKVLIFKKLISIFLNQFKKLPPKIGKLL